VRDVVDDALTENRILDSGGFLTFRLAFDLLARATSRSRQLGLSRPCSWPQRRQPITRRPRLLRPWRSRTIGQSRSSGSQRRLHRSQIGRRTCVAYFIQLRSTYLAGRVDHVVGRRHLAAGVAIEVLVVGWLGEVLIAVANRVGHRRGAALVAAQQRLGDVVRVTLIIRMYVFPLTSSVMLSTSWPSRSLLS